MQKDFFQKNGLSGWIFFSHQNTQWYFLDLSFLFMHAANLQFCAFLLFGANDSHIHKNDYASRLAEILAPTTRRFAKMIMQADSQK
jgi:hypothetical protein